MDCPRGAFCVTGAKLPEPCAAGKLQPALKSRDVCCLRCRHLPVNRGSTSCEVCGPGYRCPLGSVVRFRSARVAPTSTLAVENAWPVQRAASALARRSRSCALEGASRPKRACRSVQRADRVHSNSPGCDGLRGVRARPLLRRRRHDTHAVHRWHIRQHHQRGLEADCKDVMAGYLSPQEACCLSSVLAGASVREGIRHRRAAIAQGSIPTVIAQGKKASVTMVTRSSRPT